MNLVADLVRWCLDHGGNVREACRSGDGTPVVYVVSFPGGPVVEVHDKTRRMGQSPLPWKEKPPKAEPKIEDIQTLEDLMDYAGPLPTSVLASALPPGEPMEPRRVAKNEMAALLGKLLTRYAEEEKRAHQFQVSKIIVERNKVSCEAGTTGFLITVSIPRAKGEEGDEE